MAAAPVPFTLLGGYLGAGKTTLLNRLLATTDRRLAVLVNDVGAINVDAALIADHDGQTLTLSNGCVCCAIADDLGPVLEQVREMADGPNPPEQVVMELSGVAEPARVAPWANTTGFRLDGIVVVADADQIVELASRRFVADTVQAQLAAADLLLLTKTDLAADGGAAARRFVARHSDAPVLDAAVCDPNVVFGAGGSLPEVPVAGGGPGHTAEVVDVDEVTIAALTALVDGIDAIRAKGVVRCTDVGHPVEVQVVGRRRVVRERRDLSPEQASSSIVAIRAEIPGRHV